MLISNNNIWNHYKENNWIVITTNIGWKTDGNNPMGAGIAKAAALLHTDLPQWYGARCQKYRDDTAVCKFTKGRFLLYPTKPFNSQQPWLSWLNDASIDLIRKSTIQLSMLCKIAKITNVGLPLVGCANGRLEPSDVIPILQDYLNDDFTLFTGK